jgi:Arc/MetJ family transcription regulator
MFEHFIHIMRTNVVLDDELVAEAMKASGARTKREAIELGLKALLQMRRQAEFRQLKGRVRWVGDLDAMRRDR